MTTLYQDIRASLTAQAKTAASFPTQVAYEDYFFQPTPGTPYARLTLIPSQSKPFSVDGGTSNTNGLFQVDIFCPAQAGTADAEARADNVMSVFRTGLRLAAGIDTIKIETSQRARAMVDASWIMIPVTVNWRVFTQR